VSEKYPKKVSELPNEPYYAILSEASVTVPGDERSRTNPGHGYPEHTHEMWDMEVFPNEDEWKAEVVRLSGEKGYAYRRFKAVKIYPASIIMDVQVHVDFDEES
jgi:hypothetical protein